MSKLTWIDTIYFKNIIDVVRVDVRPLLIAHPHLPKMTDGGSNFGDKQLELVHAVIENR
jgi:hypothetical protein